MWFKNLRLYRLTSPFELSAAELDERMQEKAFRPCGPLEMASFGWVPPVGVSSAPLVHSASGCLMVCGRKEEKVLPAAVIREEVDLRVAKIEEQELRTVGRKERGRLRDDVMMDLLPRAFTRSRRLYAYVAPRLGLLVADTATATGAEELITLLREGLGSLPIRPLQVAVAPPAVLTRWVKSNQADAGFSIGDECELRDPEENGGIVRCRRQELDADEIQAHLDAGKQVVRLAVEWDDRLACVLGEDMAVRRLRFLDLVQEEAAAVNAEDSVARFDADFALMTLELERFVPVLLSVFGGEAESEASPA